MAVEMQSLLSSVAKVLANEPQQFGLHQQVQVALQALEAQRALAPLNPLLGNLAVTREGFTGTGPKTCQCCGRPF